MTTTTITIDGKSLNVSTDITILAAARDIGIYIPTLCYHPDLPPAANALPAARVFQGDQEIVNAKPDEPGKGCGLCLVEIAGREELAGACSTKVEENMVVTTINDRIQAARREKLIPILARHRHACLTCAQQEGCSRSQCSSKVPENERCCPKFGHCELQAVANYVGIADNTPKWIPTELPVISNEPLFNRDYNLCIGCTRCVRVCNDLRGVAALGFVYDETGKVQIGSLGADLSQSGCKFCTACVEVCPTGALTDKSVRPGSREEDLVPCKHACPAGIDIPGYLRLVAQGKSDQAVAVIREKVPFPGVLGRVCMHPCEDACRRGEVNSPVSICALKRHAADLDTGFWRENQKRLPLNGKKVAVVGSGPAGLTAAFYLRKKGHHVVVFESESNAGGMLRYGIPAYRLPRRILDQEIEDILSLGIDLKLSSKLGRDFALDDLKEEGFDAVFLAVGAQLSRRIPLTGCDLSDVLWGVDFLRRAAQDEPVEIKENVLVIGGGNVAVDVAMTALRQGALNVSMACLESLEEMPASFEELQIAQSEGIKILPSLGPEKVLSQNGHVTGIDMVSCTCVFDAQGNFCPQFDENRKECLLVDQIILAVGQAADLSFLKADDSIDVQNGLIVADQDSMMTTMTGIYAGGDVVKTPGAVIYAVAAGRKAAQALDQALGGDGDIEEVLFDRKALQPRLGPTEGFALLEREKMPELDPAKRKKSFDEIALGFAKNQALKEAGRCLQCDLRLNLTQNPSPPQNWLSLTEENLEKVPENEGVYQLLDENHAVLTIKGTATLRQDLFNAFEDNETAAFFEYEEDPMFSKRESELIQKYLQEHGEMPGGGDDDLDDLF